MNKIKNETLIVWTIAIALFIGAIIHWLIIFNLIEEKNPPFIKWIFDSLAVFNIIASIGLILKKSWGRKLAIIIFISQFPTHGYMFYLEHYKNWISGFSTTNRMIDLILCSVFLLALNKTSVKTIYQKL